MQRNITMWQLEGTRVLGGVAEGFGGKEELESCTIVYELESI